LFLFVFVGFEVNFSVDTETSFFIKFYFYQLMLVWIGNAVKYH